MPPLVKGPTEGDILKFDLDQNYTREVVTLLAGTNYAIGSVLGQITGSGKFQLSPATGADGSQVAAAVLIAGVNATAADMSGVVIKRGPAIVAQNELVYSATVDDDTKKAAKRAQLVTLGIVPRANA